MGDFYGRLYFDHTRAPNDDRLAAARAAAERTRRQRSSQQSTASQQHHRLSPASPRRDARRLAHAIIRAFL